MDDDVTKVEVNSTDEWMSVTNPKPEEPIRGRLLFDRIIKKKEKKKKWKKRKEKFSLLYGRLGNSAPEHIHTTVKWRLMDNHRVTDRLIIYSDPGDWWRQDTRYSNKFIIFFLWNK